MKLLIAFSFPLFFSSAAFALGFDPTAECAGVVQTAEQKVRQAALDALSLADALVKGQMDPDDVSTLLRNLSEAMAFVGATQISRDAADLAKAIDSGSVDPADVPTMILSLAVALDHTQSRLADAVSACHK